MLCMNNEVSVHCFSETEVQEAPQLAQSRQQRHCALSKTGPTQCYFQVPYSGHFAEVNITVSATQSKHAKHVSYEVMAIYQGCCRITEEPRVDEQIRSTIQIVYDTYIQAVRLKLDTQCCERRPCGEGESVSCQEKKQLCLRSLETPRPGQPDVENHNNRKLPAIEVLRTTAAVVAQPPSNLPVRGGKRKRFVEGKAKQRWTATATDKQHQDNRSLGKAHQDDRPIGKAVQPSRRRKDTCQELAAALVISAKTGLKKLKQKPKEQREHENAMQAIISCRKKDKDNLSDEELNTLLEELEAKFEARAGEEKDKANPKVWHNWYYSACLRVILHSRGKQGSDRRGRSVKLLHQIVNKIAVDQGAKALMVIRAYAEVNCRLGPASRENAQRQDQISDLVAKALGPFPVEEEEEEQEEDEEDSEEQEEEEEQGLVPFPAAWISNVTGISYREVCTTLAIPNFSVFAAVNETGLAESFCYSTAVKLWSTFAEQIPQLRMEIEACPPPNWGQLTEVTKFSWLVSKYCEMARFSSPSPTESRTCLADDDEASTSNIEAYSDPASSRSSPPSNPVREIDPSSLNTHCLSTTARSVLHYDYDDSPHESNPVGSIDGSWKSIRPIPCMQGLGGRPAPCSLLTSFSGTSNNPLTVVPSSALDEPFCQSDSLPAHRVIQCESSDTLEPGRERRRLDCSDRAESGMNPAHSARPGTRLSDTTIADVAFSHSIEHIHSVVSSTEPHIAVVATRDGDWSRSNTPAMSDSGQEAELVRTSWPTDADFEFLTNLWGDGLDFAPGEGDRMEHGQLDC